MEQRQALIACPPPSPHRREQGDSSRAWLLAALVLVGSATAAFVLLEASKIRVSAHKGGCEHAAAMQRQIRGQPKSGGTSVLAVGRKCSAQLPCLCTLCCQHTMRPFPHSLFALVALFHPPFFTLQLERTGRFNASTHEYSAVAHMPMLDKTAFADASGLSSLSWGGRSGGPGDLQLHHQMATGLEGARSLERDVMLRAAAAASVEP